MLASVAVGACRWPSPTLARGAPACAPWVADLGCARAGLHRAAGGGLRARRRLASIYPIARGSAPVLVLRRSAGVALGRCGWLGVLLVAVRRAGGARACRDRASGRDLALALARGRVDRRLHAGRQARASSYAVAGHLPGAGAGCRRRWPMRGWGVPRRRGRAAGELRAARRWSPASACSRPTRWCWRRCSAGLCRGGGSAVRESSVVVAPLLAAVACRGGGPTRAPCWAPRLVAGGVAADRAGLIRP